MTRLLSRRRYWCAHAFTHIDLLVVLCVVPLVAVGCFSASCRSRETANRVKCSSNLRQIGQAIVLYANDNRGELPRTRVSGGPNRTPTFGTGVASTQPFKDGGPDENDVTAALFLLLRTQDITSEVFTCPSSSAEKDMFGGATNTALSQSNFTDVKKNLSYSYQNPYASDSALPKDPKAADDTSAEFAIAADICSGVTGANDNVLQPTTTSSATDMKWANSNNHDKDGQNILYRDGHVAWESNPFVGVNKDNIYTTKDGKLNASPVDVTDSILLPNDD